MMIASQFMTHNGVKLVFPSDMDESAAKTVVEEEKSYYWDELNHKALGAVTIEHDGDGYVVHSKEADKFQRIRRITGYLVTDLNGWNNAKTAELNDRVKHG